jgi:hypothetical protein
MKWFFLILFFLTNSAWALNYELGISYARKKNSFDQDNYFDTESTTGSLSVYFSEMIALELSYTDAKANRFEKPPGGTSIQTYQRSEILGADLIYVILPRTFFIQPYIKGGVAQLKRKQITYTDPGNQAETLPIETAIVPDYGVGIKIGITNSLSVRISYDVWRTPVGGGVITDDNQLRAGLSWML